MALKSHLNTLYQIFFFIHIPLILLVDISPLYPPAYRPAFMDSIRLWYVATYKDRFFTDQSPSWFRMFIWMEAVLHLPVSVWALRGLAQGRREGRESPILHLTLLLFALQTALTTAVCVAEYRSWPELMPTEKNALAGLYVPYLVFAVVLGMDMYVRIRGVLVDYERRVEDERKDR